MSERLSADALSALRQTHAARREALLASYRSRVPTPADARRLTQQLARGVDATLRRLWALCAPPPGAALLAVGGYGRGELSPYSDVDVLVLWPEAPDAAGQGTISGLVSACWDIGLEIGSAVRTLQECLSDAAADITVQTALMEARPLAGSRKAAAQLAQQLADARDPRAFQRGKLLEMQQRHARYDDTPYALEPNSKESPGGLRDVQVVRWIAQAAGLGTTWRALAGQGLLTPLEARQMQRAEDMLRWIRVQLHLVAKRRQDQLLFDLQTSVANQLGIDPPSGLRASEALMRRYYWVAKAVTQLNQILLLNLADRIDGTQHAAMTPLNERFFDRGGKLEVARDTLYQDIPHAILETFQLYQRLPTLKGLSARTLRALYNARSLMDARFRADPRNRAAFMDILRQPLGQTHVLRLMNQTSVLGRYLWAFRRIVGQMQHDLFHVYTVDQHTLMVLRNVRRFFIPEHAHEYPLCARLAAQFDKPELLYIAALFHDIGKGRGGDHSEVGAVEVRRFARAHGLSAEDTDFVVFLVREHLLLSRTAQKEDLTDPDVIATFAERIGTARHLTALYLLTVADIRGTSPKVWNAWKGKLLEDLYQLASRALGGEQLNPQAELESRKQEARQLLALHMLPAGVESALWDTLDVRYFARHDAADIAWHARMLAGQTGRRAPVVHARPSPLGEGVQVMVYAPDLPDLFARICGAFDAAGFSILDAKVHTALNGHALDTFHAIAPQLDVPQRELVPVIESRLAQALADGAGLPPPRRARVSRRVRSFPYPPQVMLRPDERAQSWVLSLSAIDRPGLLYALARVLAAHQVNLQLARISTLGERVEDTFLVDGPTLQQLHGRVRFESELLDAAALPP